MASITFREVEGSSLKYWLLFGGLGLFVLFGALAWNYMHHHGHVVTGMDNQIVWGLPHVFAVFLIVAASGALNVASIASVFNKPMYKPLAPLSAILALALMLGGLLVLVLDLGRSDRLIVAMTHFNFKSMFTWNVFLYSGFFGLVGVYLWTMLDRNVKTYSKAAGTAAFIWRLVLTTGTGSLFGFLIARELYGTAMLAPMFIIMSFAYGLAIYLMVLAAAYAWTGRPLGDAVMMRLKTPAGGVRRGGAVFRRRLPPDQPVLRQDGTRRSLHPARWRHLHHAVLGRSDRHRLRGAAGDPADAVWANSACGS